jgi:uncharacterized protein (TIGR02452 family)
MGLEVSMDRQELAAVAARMMAASRSESSSLPSVAARACSGHAKSRLFEDAGAFSHAGRFAGRCSVEQEDALGAALRLAGEARGQGADPCVGVLVFCSAKRPGGGWLSGATAQEESIAVRSTWGLGCRNAGFHGVSHKDSFYSDAVLAMDARILASSPGVWLADPVGVSMAGFAAPNMRALRESGADPRDAKHAARCEKALAERMGKALRAFESMGAKRLVLGAVGCGVFEVDPALCARCWKAALSNFGAAFDEVVFALGPKPSPSIGSAFSGFSKSKDAGAMDHGKSKISSKTSR